MTWIYLPDNLESYPSSVGWEPSPLPSDSPDSTPGPFAMSSMTSTPSKSYSNDSETASIPLPSGMTSTPSIPNPGKATLTSLAPGSPANHIPKPEPVGSPKDLTMIETFGPKHESAFGYWDASTSFLRTYQASFLEMMDGRAMGSVYLETFPHWGLMQDGEFIAQPMPVPATCAAAGLSWPTPTPTPRNQNEPLDEWLQRREREKALGRNGNGFGMPLDVAVRFFPSQKPGHIPTPTAADVYTGKMKSSQQSEGSMHSVSLPDYVKRWNTPNTMDALAPKSQEALDHEHETARPGRMNPNNLRDQIAVDEGSRRWATPNTRDYVERKGMRPSRAATNRTTGYLSEEVEGSLNPDWVERYLMSLPEGWTMLNPLPDGAYDQWWQGMKDGTWWDVDPGDIPEVDGGIPRTVAGAVDRKERLTMLGNGIVPASAALAIKDMSTW